MDPQENKPEKNSTKYNAKDEVPSFRKNPKVTEKMDALKSKKENLYDWKDSLSSKMPKSLRNLTLSPYQKIAIVTLVSGAFVFKAISITFSVIHVINYLCI